MEPNCSPDKRGRVDCVFPPSDLGSGQGLRFSPAMFQEYVFPWLKALADLCHEHVARIADLFASPRGGLVLTVENTIMPETAWANIEALFEAMATYR